MNDTLAQDPKLAYHRASQNRFHPASCSNVVHLSGSPYGLPRGLDCSAAALMWLMMETMHEPIDENPVAHPLASMRPGAVVDTLRIRV